MRSPRKALDIYSALHARLRRGEFAGKLPEERQLAAEFNAARNTVRAALKMLEENNLITRCKGTGTFPVESYASARRIITVLTPTYNYHQLPFYMSRMKNVHAAIQKAAKVHNIAVEMVPVSLYNDPQRINFNFLDHLNDESMVIVDGGWYQNVFDFLKRRQCTVVLVHHTAFPRYYHSPELKNIPKEFYLLTKDISSGIENAIAYLTEQSPCNKTAYLAPYAEFRKENFRGYINGLRYFTNQKKLCFYNSENIFPKIKTMKELAAFIARWYSKERFDALVIRGGGKSQMFFIYNQIRNNSDIGLPPEVKVVLGPMTHEDRSMPTELPYFYFDNERIGRLAVQTLLYPDLSPHNRLIIPDFKLPASTANSTQ